MKTKLGIMESDIQPIVSRLVYKVTLWNYRKLEIGSPK